MTFRISGVRSVCRPSEEERNSNTVRNKKKKSKNIKTIWYEIGRKKYRIGKVSKN